MSCQLVEDLQKKACPSVAVSQACRVLGVSRSGYYAHVATHKQRLAEPLLCAASVHLKAAFAAGQKAYGSRRLRAAMAERGLAMGRHRIRTLMRINGLQPVWRRKFVHTTDSKHAMAISPNVLNRQFAQDRRLGDGPQHACWFGVHSVANGHRSKKPGTGADRSFRPGHAVCQR